MTTKTIFSILLIAVSGSLMAQKPSGKDEAMLVKEFYTTQGTWRYKVKGAGKNAMLFIHGASSSHKVWRHQFGLDFQGYKNIFVDLIGYGDSDQQNDGYSLDRWIDGLYKLTEKEHCEQIVIIAHSNGAIYAKEFYRNYPEKVMGLFVIDGVLRQTLTNGMLDWMRNTLEKSDFTSYMASMIENMPVHGLSEDDQQILKSDALKVSKELTLAELDMIMDESTWRDIVYECPVQAIYSGSPTWPQDYLNWIEKEVADTYDQWKESGHFIQMQFPERVNALITQFVRHL